jgi:hypothetical protein
MRRTFRAAALTAAAITICTAGALAGPSIAQKADPVPLISYSEHGASQLTAANLGLNDLTDPAQASDEAPALVTHAIAPALPDTVLDQDADSRPARSLGELVSDHSGSTTPDQETECLARAVYWESKGEPLAGQLSVAEVIINRSRSGRFAPTVCGVVRQPSQFSFVRRGFIPQPPSGSRDWRIAVAIAQIAMQNLADGSAPRALFFHARRVNPGWRLTRVATVGNHVFYR